MPGRRVTSSAAGPADAELVGAGSLDVFEALDPPPQPHATAHMTTLTQAAISTRCALPILSDTLPAPSHSWTFGDPGHTQGPRWRHLQRHPSASNNYRALSLTSAPVIPHSTRNRPKSPEVSARSDPNHEQASVPPTRTERGRTNRPTPPVVDPHEAIRFSRYRLTGQYLYPMPTSL
jgi:hypothetical protein